MKSLFFWIVAGYVVFSYIVYQKMENRYQIEKNSGLCQQLQIMEAEVKKRNENEILFSKRINEIEKAAKKNTNFNWNIRIDSSDPVLVQLHQD